MEAKDCPEAQRQTDALFIFSILAFLKAKSLRSSRLRRNQKRFGAAEEKGKDEDF